MSGWSRLLCVLAVPAQGVYTLADGNQTVTLQPDHDFFFGEQVMVTAQWD